MRCTGRWRPFSIIAANRAWRKYLRGEIGAQKPLERMAKLNLLIAALSTGNYVLCFDDVQIAQDVPDIAYFFKLIRQRFVELKQPLPAPSS